MIEVTEELVVENICFFQIITHSTTVGYMKHWYRGFLSS